uniref:Uncharacterized protein n=1 Tax=Crocodylus porosus TaxID=8502 RepID=A0A7M4F9Q6_CROPO
MVTLIAEQLQSQTLEEPKCTSFSIRPVRGFLCPGCTGSGPAGNGVDIILLLWRGASETLHLCASGLCSIKWQQNCCLCAEVLAICYMLSVHKKTQLLECRLGLGADARPEARYR